MFIKPNFSPYSIDYPHAVLLMGVIASSKPERVVELGTGVGGTGFAILEALNWNREGEWIIVDNLQDSNGKEPDHLQYFKSEGAKFFKSNEEDFCKLCPSEFCDVLISDADHLRSDRWVEDHFRIVRKGGFLFFHDVSTPEFPNLAKIVKHVKDKGVWHYLFDKNSRSDERCQRGWLMAIKN